MQSTFIKEKNFTLQSHMVVNFVETPLRSSLLLVNEWVQPLLDESLVPLLGSTV